jgi:predicted nucleotidyltransferase
MRLSKQETSIIKKVILENINDAKIMLFGSRVYDDKRGGDIDIFVETNQNINLKKKLKILTKLELNGIERKVDLILKTPTSKEQKIFDTIYKEGIRL